MIAHIARWLNNILHIIFLGSDTIILYSFFSDDEKEVSALTHALSMIRELLTSIDQQVQNTCLIFALIYQANDHDLSRVPARMGMLAGSNMVWR